MGRKRAHNLEHTYKSNQMGIYFIPSTQHRNVGIMFVLCDSLVVRGAKVGYFTLRKYKIRYFT